MPSSAFFARLVMPRRAVAVGAVVAVVAAVLVALPERSAHASSQRPSFVTVATVDQDSTMAVDAAGTRVAYTNSTASGREVYLYDEATGVSTLLTSAAGDGSTPAAGDSDSVAIDADGSDVAFTSAATDLDASGADLVSGTPQAYVAHLGSDGSVTLTRLPLPPTATSGASAIAISADGTRVAFAGNAGDAGTGSAYVDDWQTAGATPRPVDVTPSDASTQTVVDQVTLSGDGSTLAAVVDDGSATVADGARVVLADLSAGTATTMPDTEVDRDTPVALTGNGDRVLAAPAFAAPDPEPSGWTPPDYLLSWQWRQSGATPQQVGSNGHSIVGRPSMSSDGNLVGYSLKYDDQDGYLVDVGQYPDITYPQVGISVDESDYASPTTGYGSNPALARSLPMLSGDGLHVVFRSNSTDLPNPPAAGKTTLYLATLDDSHAPTFDQFESITVENVQPDSVELYLPPVEDDLFVVRTTVTDNGVPVTGSGSNDEYTVGNLTPGTKHVFTITAEDESGHTASESVTVWTPKPSVAGSFDAKAISGLPADTAGAGIEVDESAAAPVISGDGRYVAYVGAVFAGYDADGDPVDANGNPLFNDDGPTLPGDQVFLTDTLTGTTTLVTHRTGASTPADDPAPNSLAISADGRYLAYAATGTDLASGVTGTDPHAYVYDRTTDSSTEVPTQHVLADPPESENLWWPASMLAISADGSRVAALTSDPGSYDSTYAETADWQGSASSVIPMEFTQFGGVKLSPDGETLAVSGRSSDFAEVSLFDVPTRQSVADFPDLTALPVGFSADGSQLLLDASDPYDSVNLTLQWNRSTPERLTAFGGPEAVSFATDGTHVAQFDSDDSGDWMYLTALPDGAPLRIGSGDAPALDADGSAIAYVNEVDTDAGWHDSVFVAHAQDAVAPTWPSDAALAVSDITTTSVHLSWPAATDDNAVASYVLTEDGQPLATLPADTRDYDVTGLSPGTSHAFTVTAKDAAGNPSEELTAAATTLSAGVTPGQDPLLARADQGGIATLSWDPAGGSISGYRVMRDDGTGFVAVADVPAGKTTYTDAGLLASTAYTYRVDLLDPTGSPSAWTKTATVTTPAIEIDKATATLPYLSDGGDGSNIAALGGAVALRVVGEPNRQADARISYTLPDDGNGTPQFGSAVVALAEDPAHPGSYTGSWTIPEGAAVLNSVTGELSDGVAAHTASAAAPGLPAQVSGAIAVTVLAPPAGSLAGSTLLVGGVAIAVDGPGTYTAAVPAGTGYAIWMDTKTEQDVASATADVTAGRTTSVQLTPHLQASLTVTIVKNEDNPRFCPSAVTVTVADDAGTQLGQQQTTCYQHTVTFDGLPVGDHVTVTSTLREPGDPVRFMVQDSLTLVEGENDATVTHPALATATITGTVTGDSGSGTVGPLASAQVGVTEHVDGRDWSYSTKTDSSGHYSLGVLAGSAGVTVSYGANGLFPDTATLTLADSATVTHDVQLTRGTLTVHVDPAAGVAAGGVRVSAAYGYGGTKSVEVPDGQTEATFTDIPYAPVTISVDVEDRTKPITLHYSQSVTPQDTAIDVTFAERLLPTSTVTGTVTADGNPVPGMDVQLSERADNRDWTYHATTDADGGYTITALAGSGTVGLNAPTPSGYGLSAGHSITLPADGTAQSDFQLPAFTSRTVHLSLITTDFGSAPSPQTLDWTTNIHFATSLRDASGHSYPVGPTVTIPNSAPSPLTFCASGLQAGMPKGCVTQAFADTQPDITMSLQLAQAAGVIGTVLGPDGSPLTGTWTFVGVPLDDAARANGGYFSAFGDSSALHQGLPAAGKWRLVISGPNGVSASTVVTLAAGQTLNLGDVLLSGSPVVSGDSTVVATPNPIEPGQLLQVRAEFTTTSALTGAGVRLGIPDGTSFAAGSVTVDGTPVDASAVDAAVTVPLGDLAVGAHHVVRYAVTVNDTTTAAALSAPVWLVDGAGTLHAVGSATVPLIAVSLTAPEHATASTFTVNGTAPAGNDVTVVDAQGNTVGTGTAGPGGLWQAQVHLADSHPGRTYQLTAESDYQGQQLTDSADVVFDPDYLLPTSIAVGQPDGRFHSYNPANGVAYFTLVYRPALPVRVIAQFTDTSRIENPIAWVGANWAPMTCTATSCTADVPIADEFAGGSGVDVDYKVKPIEEPAPTPTQQQELSSLPGPFAGSRSATSATSFDYATDAGDDSSGQVLVTAAHSTGTVAVPGSGVNMDYNVSIAESAEPVGEPVDMAGGSLYASHSQSKSADGSVSMHLTLYIPADELAAAGGSVRTALTSLGMARLAAITPDGVVTKALGVVVNIGLSLLQGAEGAIVGGAQTAWGLIKAFYTPPSKYYKQLNELQDEIYAAKCLSAEQKRLLLDEVQVAGVQVTLIYAMQALAPVPLFLSGLGEEATVALATLKIGLDEALQGIINYAVGNIVSATFGNWMQAEVDDTRADVARVLLDSHCPPPPPRNCPPGSTCPAPGPGAHVTPIIDPSGVVTDASTGEPLTGVTATIETAPSKDGPWTTWNAADYGQTNPQLTDSTGAFGWDTPIGWYRVKFSKDRYVTGYSQVVHVLPEWTGLNVALQRKVVNLGVTVQPDHPVYGDPVTLHVTTTPNKPGATVTVSEDGTQLASAVLDSNGTASITVSGLHAGTHVLDVSYPGDADVFPSDTSVTVTIARAATRLTVDRISSLGGLLNFLFHRRVTAHLVRADDGTPIAGVQVTLSTRKGDICTATTDANGAITCTVPVRMMGDVLLGRVEASFAGTADYKPSDYGADRRPGRHGW